MTRKEAEKLLRACSPGAFPMFGLTGNDVRGFRQAYGWTQEEFANLMGVTQATVSRWESAFPLPERLQTMFGLLLHISSTDQGEEE